MENDETTPLVPVNPSQNALKAVLILILFAITFFSSLVYKKRWIKTKLKLYLACICPEKCRSFASPLGVHKSFFLCIVFWSWRFLVDMFVGFVCRFSTTKNARHIKRLITDSLEDIQNALKELSPDKEIKFPLTELFVAVGFILVLFIEQVYIVFQFF